MTLSRPPESANSTLSTVLQPRLSISLTNAFSTFVSGGDRVLSSSPKSRVSLYIEPTLPYIRRRMENWGRWIITSWVQKKLCHRPWGLACVFRLHFVRHPRPRALRGLCLGCGWVSLGLPGLHQYAARYPLSFRFDLKAPFFFYPCHLLRCQEATAGTPAVLRQRIQV